MRYNEGFDQGFKKQSLIVTVISVAKSLFLKSMPLPSRNLRGWLEIGFEWNTNYNTCHDVLRCCITLRAHNTSCNVCLIFFWSIYCQTKI